MVPKRAIYRGAAAIGIVILILDGQTALNGMQEGIYLCLETLVPSLFPFMVLTSIMTENMSNHPGWLLKQIGKACSIPAGCETLLLTGLLGGYPVGARNVASVYRRGLISLDDAKRLCILCNNAGPSFLFGILLPLFPDLTTVLLLWIIQILSMIILSLLLPGDITQPITISAESESSITAILNSCIRGMASVCGWVILFRMILDFFRKWFMHIFPSPVQVLLTGVLELSNGCIGLSAIDNIALRFILASTMLSFGGICVFMQTLSLCPKELTAGYCTGKMLHMLLSALLSLTACTVLRYIPIHAVLFLYMLFGIFLIFGSLKARNIKKEVAF